MSRILTSLLCALYSIILSAQTDTYYYRLSKEIIEGETNTEVSGGQFITITEYYCYDSDFAGKNIGNGVLYLDSNSSQKLNIFVGNCYYGNAIYKFSSDYSILNIEINSSLIYVYKRSSPPSGVKTSSLIKKKEGSSGGTVMVPYTPPSQGYGPPPAVLGGNSSQPEKQVREIKTRETCSRCGGKGRIVYNTYPPMFGAQDHPVRCSECGETHLRSVGHSHITCPDCNGRGYKEHTSYKYE